MIPASEAVAREIGAYRRAEAEAASLSTALAAPANADVSDTGVFGYWTTFAGVANDGKPVCRMGTDWGVGGQTGSGTRRAAVHAPFATS